jgi:hypothetical protein
MAHKNNNLSCLIALLHTTNENSSFLSICEGENLNQRIKSGDNILSALHSDSLKISDIYYMIYNPAKATFSPLDHVTGEHFSMKVSKFSKEMAVWEKICYGEKLFKMKDADQARNLLLEAAETACELSLKEPLDFIAAICAISDDNDIKRKEIFSHLITLGSGGAACEYAGYYCQKNSDEYFDYLYLAADRNDYFALEILLKLWHEEDFSFPLDTVIGWAKQVVKHPHYIEHEFNYRRLGDTLVDCIDNLFSV